MKYGRGQSKDMISKFVKMYVNEITVDMGERGKTSIEQFFNWHLKKILYLHFKSILPSYMNFSYINQIKITLQFIINVTFAFTYQSLYFYRFHKINQRLD